MRLEVLGVLWGALEALETARVVNLGRGGALIAATTSLPVGSMRSIRLSLGGTQAIIEARVRHLRASSEHTVPPSFLIGLEFVGQTTFLDDLDDLKSMSDGLL